jgi:hypothetical protein
MVEFFATHRHSHQGAINSRGKTAQTLKTQRRQHFFNLYNRIHSRGEPGDRRFFIVLGIFCHRPQKKYSTRILPLVKDLSVVPGLFPNRSCAFRVICSIRLTLVWGTGV